MTSTRRPAGFAALPVKAQGVQGDRAGAASRGAANIIDALVLFVGFIGLYLGVAAVKFLWRPRTFTFPAPSWNVITIIVCGVTALYFAVAWMTTGRTYGDRVLGLRVVNHLGGRVHALTALLRAAACVIVPTGLLWVAVDRNSRSLQDLIFRTSVVYDWSDTVH